MSIKLNLSELEKNKTNAGVYMSDTFKGVDYSEPDGAKLNKGLQKLFDYSNIKYSKQETFVVLKQDNKDYRCDISTTGNSTKVDFCSLESVS